MTLQSGLSLVKSAKPFVGALAIALSLTACTSGQQTADKPTDGAGLPGEGVSVTPSYGLLEELFQTEVVNIGLERLGYSINKPKELEYATMHVDIANGGIDYTPAHWQLNQKEFFENSGGDEKLERAGIVVADVLQGYKIDKATADEYNITSLDQLQDPEIAALFDSDGDGKANLIGCNTGWGCELTIEHQLEEYGLKDTVQHDQGQYFALIADALARSEQGEPILFYTWTPLWIHGVLKEGEDVTWIEVPYTSLPEAQGEVTEADTSVDGKNLGFGVDQQLIVANQEFIDNNPAAAKFFSLVQVPIDDISAQNQLVNDGEDSPEAIRGHAEAWVADNQSEFDGWVETALSAQ
ncbi:glycine betaine/L-proline ABC transporter substrate-binding protein ProX [Leptolyngbya cf. ectocarpi LEGE 11479]|uniref:Glycine betaine/L-proline ABC transporter substrate-binding protein ProX n=1 Tax=Leptolyngbya cf. ectocarpi LEGE 11479 TaxID=1828722 RepID=A0A929F9X5_LEPEC|nr:glycine betaine/L-proline ABC transporter substrate-binding protein ProX [Leptolyngbya ectocarpi]MBE9068092.1 glycine betaine/L-proline ABC transporter substrate-binding protein ProX [Leptolyngbya cf. ectocarpi LEGE 11479]